MRTNKLLWMTLAMLLSYGIHAQSPGAYPSVLDDGCTSSSYSDTTTIVFIADTIISGFTVTVDSVQTTGFANLPAGLSASCFPSSCTAFPPGAGQSASQQVLISGSPSATVTNHTITIYHTYWTTFFGSPQSAMDSTQITISINALSSTIDTRTECDSLVWLDGNTYYSNNNTAAFTFNDGNPNTCDSTVVLDLTITSGNTAGSQTETVCDSYTWPANAQIYSASGVYTTTLSNTNGCDSIVTLNLTILNSTTGSQTETACDSYTWPANAQPYSTSGVYTATLTNSIGCDSVVTLNLTINETPNNTVTVAGDTLTAAAVSVTYHWLTCESTLTEIPGETNQSYVAMLNGEYAVIVESNGCVDTSACTPVNGVGINRSIEKSQVLLYPNPTHGDLTIQFETLQSESTITVRSLTGQVVSQTSAKQTNRITLDINQPNGLYFLEVSDQNAVMTTFRIVKE